MALIDFFDFENYASGSGTIDAKLLADGWHGSVSMDVTEVGANVRTGTRAAHMDIGFSRLQYRTPQDQSVFGVGFGWFFNSGTPQVKNDIFQFQYNDGTTKNVQIKIGRDLNNAVTVTRGSTF